MTNSEILLLMIPQSIVAILCFITVFACGYWLRKLRNLHANCRMLMSFNGICTIIVLLSHLALSVEALITGEEPTGRETRFVVLLIRHVHETGFCMITINGLFVSLERILAYRLLHSYEHSRSFFILIIIICISNGMISCYAAYAITWGEILLIAYINLPIDAVSLILQLVAYLYSSRKCKSATRMNISLSARYQMNEVYESTMIFHKRGVVALIVKTSAIFVPMAINRSIGLQFAYALGILYSLVSIQCAFEGVLSLLLLPSLRRRAIAKIAKLIQLSSPSDKIINNASNISTLDGDIYFKTSCSWAK